MIKFLPGIIILQAITAGLTYLLVTGEPSSDDHLFFALIALDITFILLMALWFSSLARQNNFASMESLKEAHAKEREKLRVNAERQKNRLATKKHKEVLRETKRAYTMANIKAGSVVVGLVLLGGVLLYSQFIAFGSMLLTAGGGGLLGYLARAKQESLFQRSKSTFLSVSPEVNAEKKTNNYPETQQVSRTACK
ncbi:hypothetical protein [Candidatus Electrothrix sp.]|uniref:hypothetical protein n=1 Tax=Candidatus Electrothrix sp. TaxID=2170559 RepID=UPI004057A5D0